MFVNVSKLHICLSQNLYYLMSDSEEYVSEESYEFEFEDDDDVSVPGSDMNEDADDDQLLQNEYYRAKSFKDDDTQVAIEKLTKLTQRDATADTIPWIYKSTKQIAKIHFADHQLDQCLIYLNKLKQLLPSMTNIQYLDESINKTFINYGNVKDDGFRLKLYQFILDFIAIIGSRPSNDRLWIKSMLNQFSILLEQNELDKCATMIDELNIKLDQVSEITRNSYSLEVIAGEIELMSLYKTVDMHRLRYLYNKSLTIVSPVTHPRIVGIIKECGGKLEFSKGRYEESRSNFYDGFKSFDESGSSEKDRCFKYLILLSLITDSEFNPFESQETQHYAQEEGFEELKLMIECYTELDLNGYKKIFQDLNPNFELVNDPIFSKSISLIQDLMIEKTLTNFFKAYSRMTFSFVQDYLHLDEAQLQEILFRMGVEGKLHNVRVDFIEGLITSVTQSTKNTVPSDIDVQQVLINIKAFASLDIGKYLNIDDSSMSVDTTPTVDASSTFEPKLDETSDKFCKSAESVIRWLMVNKRNSLRQSEIDEAVNTYFCILKSSIPDVFMSELSTKDQIYTEQRLGSTNPEVIAQLQNNKTVVYDSNEKIRQLDLWSKELIRNVKDMKQLYTSI